MFILADENCDAVLVARLRGSGHDVVHILEQKPGTPDEDILEAAAAQDRILLTNDLDFGMLAERLELISSSGRSHAIGSAKGKPPSRHCYAFL